MNHVKNEGGILPETNTESTYGTVKSAILSCLLLMSINQLGAQDTIVTPKITPIIKESGIKHRLSFALGATSNPVFSGAIGVQQTIPGTITYKPYGGVELTLLSNDIKNRLYAGVNGIIGAQKEIKEDVNIYGEVQGGIGFTLKDELNRGQHNLIPTVGVAGGINKVLGKHEIGLLGQRTRNILEKDWENMFVFGVRFTRKVD